MTNARITEESKPFNFQELQEYVTKLNWKNISDDINETQAQFEKKPSKDIFNTWRDQLAIAFTFVNIERVTILYGNPDTLHEKLWELKSKIDFVETQYTQFLQQTSKWMMPPTPSYLNQSITFVSNWIRNKTKANDVPENKTETEMKPMKNN